jgi:hypothetical protein
MEAVTYRYIYFYIKPLKWGSAMSKNSTEKCFAEYPKFFVKVDGKCETVTFDCIENNERKSTCKKQKSGDIALSNKIAACLLSYSRKSARIDDRVQLLANNCIKNDAHFKYLGFMDKEALDAFMSENFALLCELKPKAVGWKRFLLDIGAVYNEEIKGNK